MWYRIIASGPVGNGPIKHSPEDAWDSWNRIALRTWFYCGESSLGSARAAMHAQVIEATTRSAARSADISLGSSTVGKGSWYRL